MKKYTPTPTASIQDKERFEIRFKMFVNSGFERSKFTKWFYQRLSLCFGFIAHFNQDGFYSYWFRDVHSKTEFLKEIESFQCYGEPSFTFSDVECELREWVTKEKLVEKYLGMCDSETERRERAELARLKAKYE